MPSERQRRRRAKLKRFGRGLLRTGLNVARTFYGGGAARALSVAARAASPQRRRLPVTTRELAAGMYAGPRMSDAQIVALIRRLVGTRTLTPRARLVAISQVLR